MRFVLLTLLAVFVALAQEAPPQTVAFIESPDNPAFAQVTPKPDFAPVLVLRLKITAAVYLRITVQGSGETAKPLVHHVPFEASADGTPYWTSMGITLPTGFSVVGVQVQLMAPIGSPAPVPTAP